MSPFKKDNLVIFCLHFSKSQLGNAIRRWNPALAAAMTPVPDMKTLRELSNDDNN